MAKNQSGCLYLILGLIALGIIMWALQNIVGLAGLGLAGWAGYQLYKKYNNDRPYKVEAVFLVIGLIVGIGWFAFSLNPTNPAADQATIGNTSQQNNTVVQTTYVPTDTNASSESTTEPSISSQSAFKLIPAQVVSVIDGDTIEVKIDGKTEKVRLIGVDTPETKHPSKPVQSYGLEASKYTTSQLNGKKVFLEKDVEERDKYGRLLAYVWLLQPVTDDEKEVREKQFNAKLLLDGYGQLMTVPPNVKYVDYFTAFQTEARDANKGLWGIEVSAPVEQSSASAEAEKFVASASSNKYHYPDCRWAKKIKPSNLIEFDSPDEARKSGYVPCKVCSPP